MTLIERLRVINPFPDSLAIRKEAADLIESQAARIAELEAERDNFHMEYRMKCDVETKQLHEELAALRRKIDEAPVVAWLCNGETYQVKQCSIITDEEFPDQVPLISKEDLK